MRKRRKFTASFKSKVALEALREDRPLNTSDAAADVLQQHPICLYAHPQRICASSSTCSRSAGCRLRSVTTSTRRPRRSCASMRSAPSARPVRPGGKVTSRSMSLASSASPRAIEPKTRTSRRPCRSARARISARWDSIRACISRMLAGGEGGIRTLGPSYPGQLLSRQPCSTTPAPLPSRGV